jgi:hypothetical protein
LANIISFAYQGVVIISKEFRIAGRYTNLGNLFASLFTTGTKGYFLSRIFFFLLKATKSICLVESSLGIIREKEIRGFLSIFPILYLSVKVMLKQKEDNITNIYITQGF